MPAIAAAEALPAWLKLSIAHSPKPPRQKLPTDIRADAILSVWIAAGFEKREFRYGRRQPPADPTTARVS
jgi:hypothetical protein